MTLVPALKNWLSIARCSAFALALLAVAPEAHAWTYRLCDGSRLHWNAERAALVLGSQLPAGSPGSARLEEAAWQWNQANSRFAFSLGHGGFSTTGKNGRNEVVISSEGSDGPGDTLAVTTVHYHCNWIPIEGWEFGFDETDIVFDSAESWSFEIPPAGDDSSGRTNFALVALHELGHALGLDHENRVMATMNSEYPGGGPLGSARQVAPLPDDRMGARALYGGSGTSKDVAASAFRSLGGGESGVISNPATATHGSPYTFRYTVGNLGTSNQTFAVDFYFSYDQNIAPAEDFFLGTTDVNAPVGTIGTLNATVTIPWYLYDGYYYMGVIVDPENVIAESNEANNTQHLATRVKLGILPACNDGEDNDSDGFTDYPADEDCFSQFGNTEFGACADGLDNDTDGLMDHPDDPGCTSVDDTNEWDGSSTTLPCDDGLDNDGDGRIDAGGLGSPYLVDLGCQNPLSTTESPECNDGLDNDGDGRLDFDGGAWLDRNYDGFVDAQFNPATPAVGVADPECEADFSPWGDSEMLPEPGAMHSLASGIALLVLLARRQRRAVRRQCHANAG